jgi:hypothetical protein
MGTSLTGLTPSTTYDALIKVGDNGPLSATAKVLSDGLGNDSVLALSTTAVGIGTSTPAAKLDVNGGSIFRGSISGFGGGEVLLNAGNNSQVGFSTNGTGSCEMFFDQRGTANGIFNFRDTTATRMTINAGNVGIGTSAPNYSLQINSSTTTTRLQITNSTTGTGAANGLQIIQGGNDTTFSQKTNGFMSFETNNVERVRVTANGLTFNGDTAAANALDDYEEGTWTMGLSFGGGTTGITYVNRTGRYTKIGRQVTASGYVALSSKGSSTGDAEITGLPFTNASVPEGLAPVILRYDNVSFTNAFQGFVNTGSNSILLGEITILGSVSNLTNADFQNGSSVMVSVTYSV